MFTIESFEAADGTRLRYGKLTDPHRGEPAKRSMLFVPGLGGSVKGALSFLEAMLPTFDPIYGPDLRGFGLNEHAPLPHPDMHLDDLLAFQHHTELIAHPATTLCGISLGGTISTKLAAKQREDFESLILVAPAFRSSSICFPPSFIARHTLGRLLRGVEYKTALPYCIKKLTRNLEALANPVYMGEPLVLPVDYLLKISLFNMVAFHRVKEIAIPTMVIVPGSDVVCDPDGMRAGYHRIPNHVPKLLKDYPDLYHDVLMEPEVPEVAQDVLDWIQTIGELKDDEGRIIPVSHRAGA